MKLNAGERELENRKRDCENTIKLVECANSSWVPATILQRA